MQNSSAVREWQEQAAATDEAEQAAATAADILAGADPNDRHGNITRLVDAGWSREDAHHEAVGHGATAKLASAKQRREDTDRETAAKIATSADLFRSSDGVPFATIEVDGHREHVSVRSRRFKAWLTRRFRAEKGKAPSSDALSVAQTEAEAIAELEGEVHEVVTRIGYAGGRLYVDLCDERWRAIEVDRDGWRIVSDPPVRFHRPSDAVALPEPVRGGTLDALRPFVNAPEDDDWRMMLAWLIGAIAPDGPYPLLVLYGEQGSAKSTTSRRLREVIDPAKTITRETPKGTHDLAIAAKRCRVLAYDNLSWLTTEMSDALCRLATGGGLGTRRLYSDDEEATFYAKRPIILNGIEEVATRGDLLSRAVVLSLPTLAVVRDERTMDEEWTQAHPAILGALLDAASAALRNVDGVKLERTPRMADFARWVVASEAVPGFLDVYAENREDAQGAEIDSSVFAAALIDYAEAVGTWEGTASELLGRLDAGLEGFPPKGWPTTARACSDRVRRHATALRSRGVAVEIRRAHGRRLITLAAEQKAATADALPL